MSNLLLRLTFAAGLLSLPVAACGGQQKTGEVMGHKLSPAAQNFWDKVERSLGKKIVVEQLSARGEHGKSKITKEGVPTLGLNPASGSEATVVHELFHLEMQAGGYPLLPHSVFFRENAWPSQAAMERIGKLLEHVLTDISSAGQHAIFYPKMRRMGYDPTLGARSDVETWLKSTGAIAQGLSQDEMAVFAAATYARFAMESGSAADSDVLGRLKQRYAREGLGEYAARGERVAELWDPKKNTTPEAWVESYRKSMEIIYSDLAEVRLKEAQQYATGFPKTRSVPVELLFR